MPAFTQCLVGDHDNCPERVEVVLEEDFGGRTVTCVCKCHKDAEFDPRWERGLW